jgi:CBS-domain-containing membrane protein
MQISELRAQLVEIVDPEASRQEAARRMQACNIGTLPVWEGTPLVDILTERDIHWHRHHRSSGRGRGGSTRCISAEARGSSSDGMTTPGDDAAGARVAPAARRSGS